MASGSAEKAYIELRRPKDCGECHFMGDYFDFDCDEHYEACRAACFTKSPDPKRLYDGDYKNGCYTIPEWCTLKPVNDAKVRLVVAWPGSCLECDLFTPLEEGDDIENYVCYAVHLLNLERIVAENVNGVQPEIRYLTDSERRARKRPAWCPLKKSAQQVSGS